MFKKMDDLADITDEIYIKKLAGHSFFERIIIIELLKARVYFELSMSGVKDGAPNHIKEVELNGKEEKQV